MLYPKLFTTLKGYTKEQFFSDAIAGIVVGIVAIPLAIAFAIASGVSPEKGLITAVIAGFLISALGGSRVQIGGPTGAFVVVIYGVIQQYGAEGLLIATFLAGIILIIMGWARFGTIIKFIPHAVMVGFTSGIAVIIFSSQVKDFLGLNIASVPVDFHDKWIAFFQNVNSINFYAVVLSLLTIGIIAFWPKAWRKVPGALVAILLTSAFVHILKLPVETIGARFGELPHTFPAPHLPWRTIDIHLVQNLFQAAFTIALLGAIESLLSAVISDGMIGGRHRSNMELIGQGVANIGSALFGGIPATGAIARTVTNIKNGGRTPVAGIIHALTVLLMMLLFGRFIDVVPLSCLAGILVVVAYHMSEWRSFRELLRSRGDAAVLLSTFFVTVFIDLSAAIELGVVLSAFLFVKRMSEVTNIRIFAKEFEDDEKNGDQLSKILVPPGVEIYEINGPLFFAAANRFEETDRALHEKPKVRILRFRDVPLIDSSGMYALKSFYGKCKKSGIHLIITGLHVQPLNEMVKSDLYDLIGEENVFSSMKEALERAQKVIS